MPKKTTKGIGKTGAKSARRRAEKYARDPGRIRKLLDDAMKKAKRRRGRLSEVWGDLMALLRLIGSWVNGSYREVPWESIIWAIAAVIYLLNPFDLIPDFIPGVGFLDDAAVIVWVIKLIKGDLDDFKAWEKTKSDAATDPTTSSPTEADEALPPQD